MTQYRELKNYEKARAKSQPRKRTIEEKWAYWYLPMSMRRHIFKNHAIAFEGESASLHQNLQLVLQNLQLYSIIEQLVLIFACFC